MIFPPFEIFIGIFIFKLNFINDKLNILFTMILITNYHGVNNVI